MNERRRRQDRWRPDRSDASSPDAAPPAPVTPVVPPALSPDPVVANAGATDDQPATPTGGAIRPVHQVDEDAIEWVLRRAVQLADTEVVTTGRIPAASLEQAAAELQVPITALADALAEYRAGGSGEVVVGATGPAPRGALDRLVGPGVVAVRHHTGIDEDAARSSMQYWLKRRHRLRSRINADGTVVAVRRRGAIPAVARGVRSATGRAGLSGVKEVRGAAISAEPGYTSLCLVADLRDHRAQSAVAGSAVALGGTAVVSTVALLTAPVVLVGVPVAVGAGWAVGRVSHWIRVRQVTEEIEMTADEVAAGAAPTSLVDEIGSRLVRRRPPGGP